MLSKSAQFYHSLGKYEINYATGVSTCGTDEFSFERAVTTTIWTEVIWEVLIMFANSVLLY